MRIPRCLPLIALFLLTISRADVRSCSCDIEVPSSLEARECSLCKEAEKQPPGAGIFFLRDANPTKPNRWLALPRYHGNQPQQLNEMSSQQRAVFWTAAITKAREVWPNQPWGVALNSTAKRSQCHLHLHIGKLLSGIVDERFVVVDRAADIPVPEDGDGIWIHAVDGRLHVHTAVPDGELNLER